MNWKRLNLIESITGGRAFETGLLLKPKLKNDFDRSPGTPQETVLNSKRLYDACFAALGLILLSPIFLLIAVVIKLADRGKIFYQQTRIGQFGIPFQIYKFRTMVPGADYSGPHITSDGDRRITRIGSILRRTKLDELPQLWNVLRGEMSLVGPRPEVPRYVEQYSRDQRAILRIKPGITDLASLRFRNEESLLASSDDTEAFYVAQCLPRKLTLNYEYSRNANLLTDTWIIIQTICPYWIGVLAVYAILLTTSLLSSYVLITDFTISGRLWQQFASQAPLVVALQLVCLLARRQCKGLLCYFGLPELWQITLGQAQAFLVLLLFSLLTPHLVPKTNILLIDFCLSIGFLSGFRLLLRRWRERAEGAQTGQKHPQMRVGIIGAGSQGAQLARYFNARKGLGRTAVAFFDDDFGKWHKQIHEVPVVGMPECLLLGWSEKLDEVAIASSDVSPGRIEQINQLFQKTKLRVYTIQWPGAVWPDAQT